MYFVPVFIPILPTTIIYQPINNINNQNHKKDEMIYDDRIKEEFDKPPLRKNKGSGKGICRKNSTEDESDSEDIEKPPLRKGKGLGKGTRKCLVKDESDSDESIWFSDSSQEN